MSFSIAFATGPLLGAQVLQRWGGRALWEIAFASGCISTALMGRIGSKPHSAPASAEPAR
jgi:hypothetical protein